MENESKKTEKRVAWYRQPSDEWFLKHDHLLTPPARKKGKRAYNLVLKERD